jgi:hypothetical protein
MIQIGDVVYIKNLNNRRGRVVDIRPNYIRLILADGMMDIYYVRSKDELIEAQEGVAEDYIAQCGFCGMMVTHKITKRNGIRRITIDCPRCGTCSYNK